MSVTDRAHWNHRVIEYVDTDGSPWFQIHEVYYDAEGKPQAYTENPVPVHGVNVEEISKTLERMQACLSKPVLKETDFDSEKQAEGW